jgi:hypothetical protein
MQVCFMHITKTCPVAGTNHVIWRLLAAASACQIRKTLGGGSVS